MNWDRAKKYSALLHVILILVLLIVSIWHRTPEKKPSVLYLAPSQTKNKHRPLHQHQSLHKRVPKKTKKKKALRIHHKIHKIKVRKTRQKKHRIKRRPHHAKPLKSHSLKASHPLSHKRKKVVAQAKKKHLSALDPLSELNQELMREDENLAKERAQDRLMSEYQTRIRRAIAQHWRIPSGTKKHQVCQLALTLDLTGKVLEVKIIKRSGFLALDQAAVSAVWQASPLPVPQGMGHAFEHIELTLHPETVW